MERLNYLVRPNWEDRCKEVGFDFCSILSNDGMPYWSEGVGYKFTLSQIDHLEDSTNELHAMCLQLVADIISGGEYPVEYGLPDHAKALIERSWSEDRSHLYGRFDFAFDGTSIKMLEYNADTPTGLLEASVVQWNWIEDLGLPDQFNSIHEKLIERWSMVTAGLPADTPVHFLSSQGGGREDWGTIEYLMDTALQANLPLSEVAIDDLGWDSRNKAFVDLADRPLKYAFKLYPWEWMFAERSGRSLPQANTRWIEPAWKALLSSKALLPLLWQRHEGHPLLLPSYFHTEDSLPSSGKWVKKPLYAREGANVSLIENGMESELLGSAYIPKYDKRGYVLQEWVDLPVFDGFRPIIGSWVIGDESAGIGIREEKDNLVTGNCSHFVPHSFVE